MDQMINAAAPSVRQQRWVARRYVAAASSAVGDVIFGPERPARWLGTCPSALYLAVDMTPMRSGVVAVLTHDAARLPCGAVVATTSGELPLTGLAPAPADLASVTPWVGGGQLGWNDRTGAVLIEVVREWAPARVERRPAEAGAVAELRALVGSQPAAAIGLEPGLLGALVAACRGAAGAGVAAVRGLLGRGPGLTPAGDDVLAGFLVGARAFGLDAADVREAVAGLAPGRTTALSAALLGHALAGYCIDQVAALAGAVTGPAAGTVRGSSGVVRAFEALLAVGHTSGLALACGLARAAEATADSGATEGAG